MRALVTGGGGRLGNVLVRELLADGWHVQVFEPSERPLASLDDIDVELVRGSVLEAHDVDAHVRDVDAVFHLAAKIDLGRDRDGSMRAREVSPRSLTLRLRQSARATHL